MEGAKIDNRGGKYIDPFWNLINTKQISFDSSDKVLCIKKSKIAGTRDAKAFQERAPISE